jgi:hypothetical protein
MGLSLSCSFAKRSDQRGPRKRVDANRDAARHSCARGFDIRPKLS